MLSYADMAPPRDAAAENIALTFAITPVDGDYAMLPPFDAAPPALTYC